MCEGKGRPPIVGCGLAELCPVGSGEAPPRVVSSAVDSPVGVVDPSRVAPVDPLFARPFWASKYCVPSYQEAPLHPHQDDDQPRARAGQGQDGEPLLYLEAGAQ